MRHAAFGFPRHARIPRSPRSYLAVCLMTAAVLLMPGCGSDGDAEKQEDATQETDDAIIRTAEKGPVSMRVELKPKAPRLSDTLN